MKWYRLRNGLLAALLATAWACSGDDGGVIEQPACQEGQTQDCTQENGAPGSQKCVNGAWAKCGCPIEGEVVNCQTACGTTGSKMCTNGAWSSCTPPIETCNNIDDNCDGQKDENLSEPCQCGATQGTKTCMAGTWGPCSAGEPTAQVETYCDGKDDDCNGQVDEGCDNDADGYCDKNMMYEGSSPKCAKGPGDCDDNAQNVNPGATEVCNGIDDNCDGVTDDIKGTMLCGKGECEHEIPLCVEGKENTCTPDEAMEGATGPEENFPASDVKYCDKKDNDCDGQIDEGQNCCQAGESQPCGQDEGECKKGTQVCGGDGKWGVCQNAIDASDEVCDNKDNDCDGATDEDVVESCTCGGKTGTKKCTSGEFGPCSAGEPTAEVCNGKDDDCDGKIDNGMDPDEYEANDTCEKARDLGEIQENPEQGIPTTLTVSGTLYKKDGAEDVDWYKIKTKEISDWLPCNFGWPPTDGCYGLLVILTPPEDVDYDLCMYLEDCEGGPDGLMDCQTTAVKGGEESTALGWQGVYGLNDDETLFIQVKGKGNKDQSCTPYLLTFEFISMCPDQGVCWYDQ